MPPGSGKSPHDVIAGVVFAAKVGLQHCQLLPFSSFSALFFQVLSLSSSAVGAVMVPVLSSYLWDAATERPSMMMFTIGKPFIYFIYYMRMGCR